MISRTLSCAHPKKAASVSWRWRARHIQPAAGNGKIRPMRYAGFVLGIGTLIATWHFISDRPLNWRPGALVADDPQQVDLERAEPIGLKDARLVPHAQF